MRSTAVLIPLRILAMASAAYALGDGASLADPTTRQPNWRCRWDGTAPFCDGECAAGEIFSGAASNDDRARQLLPDSAPLFGASCATGIKAWCCTYSCPDGWRLMALEPGGGSGNKRICEKIETGSDTPSTQGGVETKPRNGPIEAPGPVEETDVNKGPIAAPGPLEGTGLKKGPLVGN
jgi:hypothetical protein